MSLRLLSLACLSLTVVSAFGSGVSDSAASLDLARFNPRWPSAQPGTTYSVNLPTAALLGNGALGAVNGGDANRKFFELTRGDLWSCGNMTRATPISFGYLEVVVDEKSVESTDTLDIVSAMLHTEGKFGKGTVKLDSFVASGEDLFVVRGVSSADDEWTLRFTAHSQSSLGQSEAHGASDGFWVRRSTVNLAPENPRSWTTNATASVSAVGASLSAGVVLNPRSAEAKLKVKANQPFAIVVSPDPSRRFDVAALDRIQSAHGNWWRTWWGRSRVSLNDEELERFYYGQLYLLGAGVRQGKFPPGLYGIWPTTDAPSWKNDFHLNYNYVATYYGCFTGNRPEVAESMPDPLIAYLPRARVNAKEGLRTLEYNYNKRRMLNTKAYLDRRPDLAQGIDDAAFFPVCMGPWGLTASGDYQHCGQISDGAFQCAVMCTHWEYTLDRAYLKKVWPVFDMTANFFLKWCEKETLPNGGYRYLVYDSHWEGSGLVKNSSPALGAVRRLFATLVEVTPVLREIGIAVPAEKAAAWRDMSEHLSALPTGLAKVGGKDVRTLSGVEEADGRANLALCANTVTLESVIPGEAFAFDVTDEFRTIATNTVNAIWEAGKDGIWTHGANQTPKLYAMAIRMGYPCEPIIEAFKKFEIRRRGQLNFHLHDNVHGVEKIGAMEFINSMLLQSDRGFVKVFPNWTGADASFDHLRAKGAFLVSAKMTAGQVTRVEVVAEKGGTFRLVDPFGGCVTPPGVTRGTTRFSREPTLEINLKPGERVVWERPQDVWGAGTSRVPEGYQELSSIESTGEQWLDTGFVTTDQTAIDIDFTVTGDFENHAYFCGDWVKLGHLLVLKNKSKMEFYGDAPQLLVCPTVGKRRYRLAVVPGGAPNAFLYDVATGAQVAAATVALPHTERGPMTLFAANHAGLYPAAYRLHAFKLVHAGETVRDYVPVRRTRDGAVGLYDLVTMTFAASVGPKPFRAGSVVAPPPPAKNAFRFYRFKVDAQTGDGLQISEIKLFNGTTDVTRAACHLHFDATTRANARFVLRTTFEPALAFDGDLKTKWYDDRAGSPQTVKAAWVTLEYVQPLEVTRYEWYTADQTWRYPLRSPAEWHFQGSNDNRTWTDLDVKRDVRTTAADTTRAYVWEKGKSWPITQAYSLLTHDGRRMVSRDMAGSPLFELVPTNALPATLPPVRPWKIYCLTSSHTDIGLDRSSYWKRHGSVLYMDHARELVNADPNDADPAAYRYTVEGSWFFDNYPMERGAAATRQYIKDVMMRNRVGVSALCAGNITEAYGFEQMCRSVYARKRFEDRWNLAPKTMFMADNPGLSWGLVQPCVEAGVENLVFLPNQWNPLPSTIWPRDKSKPYPFHNPDAGAGGSRVDVRWKSPLPMVYWWEAADRSTKMLVWAHNHYSMSSHPFGINGKGIAAMERMLPEQLALMEKRYPYDVWFVSRYADFEDPNTRISDSFKAWNKKWRWPEMRTVANPDEPFDLLRAKWSDQIPTLRGDMASGWVQFLHSMPECLARKVVVDQELAATEAEAAVRAVTKGEPYPAEDFARAWWGLVMNDEHSYATPEGYQGRRIFETIMQHFDWVEKAEQTAERFANGKLKMENVKWFEAAHRGEKGAVQCSGGDARTLENRYYRVKEENGLITSIYDKELGRELLNGPANDFRYTRDNHKTWEKDAAAALGANVTRRVRLDPDEKRIWVEIEIRHAKNLRCRSHERYRRYGYLAFPFDVPGGTFYAQINGPVMRPYLDLTGHTSDAYVGARDWVGVENGEFGVALVQRDTLLVEFGEIHPDKTCYTGKLPAGKSAIYPCLFNDWLVEHRPDGESFNLRYRYAITSYKGTWQDAHLPALAARTVNPRLAALSQARVKTDCPNVILSGLKVAEDGTGLIARFRETEGRVTMAHVWQNLLPDATVARNTILEKPWTDGPADVLMLKPYQYATVRISNGKKLVLQPADDSAFKYTGLISEPKAIHGERLGQIYLEWGLDPSPAFDHWELYRGESADFPRDQAHFVANVKPDVIKGLAFAVNRFDDRGLKTHTRYHYAIRTVHTDGTKGAFHTCSALTRDVPQGVLTTHGEADR